MFCHSIRNFLPQKEISDHKRIFKLRSNFYKHSRVYVCLSVCLSVCHRFFYDVIGRKSGTSRDVARRRTT